MICPKCATEISQSFHVNQLLYPSKRHARIATLRLRQNDAQERKAGAATVAEFEAAMAQHNAIDTELRELDATPDSFDCTGCGKEKTWGDHILMVVQEIVVPPTDGTGYKHIRLSIPMQVPYCSGCAERVGLPRLTELIQAKLQGKS